MTLKCPCCGRTTAPPKDTNGPTDTMFFPVLGGNDRDLVFCIACRNVVSGPPADDGCLFLPSDELLASELAAIQQTAQRILDAEREVVQKIEAEPQPHEGPGAGYHVHDDGVIEFCFKKTSGEKFVMNLVKTTLDKLGFANAKSATSSALCRRQCPSKKGYQHVMVQIVEAQDG